MADKKQSPVVVVVLILVIICSVLFNLKRIGGRVRRKPAKQGVRKTATTPRTRKETATPLDIHDLSIGKKPEVQPEVSKAEKSAKKVTLPTIKVELKRLTSGSTYDTQPVFSPNGREIAFVSFNKTGQNIYIMKSKNPEEPVQLTQGDFLDSHPSWAPDGSKIIFSSNRHGKEDELFWVDKFTGDVTSVDKAGMMPMLSPDGERMAFVEQHNIWIMRLATKEFYPLTKSGYNSWPSWDKEGKKIYFSSSGFMKVADHKGSQVVSLTSSGFSDYPAVSSDNRLVYVSLDSGKYDLWMMDIDGSEKAQLTGDDAREYFPCWSPDGDSIVFASNASGLSNLWLLTLP